VRELYVYYRVGGRDVTAARRDIAALQAALRAAHPGLLTRLLRRPDAQDGVETWMEVYTRPASAAGVDLGMQADIEARAAAHCAHLEGPRHVEVFVALDPA
jgi:hypothetical protein